MKACTLCATTGCGRVERRLDGIALLRCESCGFTYADLPDEFILDANSGNDEKAADTYQTTQTILDDAWFQRIVARFTKQLGPARVLDVGCGNGRLLHHFARSGWSCCGVDTSPWAGRPATQYGFELFNGTIESIAPRIGKFDLVVSSSTLEHIAEPVPHIRAISQVLKPGGYGHFCGMPNCGSLSVRLGISAFHNNRPPRHVNYFTASSLHKLFEFADPRLQQVEVRSYGIPELHRAYNAVTEFIRARGARHARKTPSQARRSSEAASAREPSGNRNPLMRFALGTYYHVGRFASAGDALEATILK